MSDPTSDFLSTDYCLLPTEYFFSPPGWESGRAIRVTLQEDIRAPGRLHTGRGAERAAGERPTAIGGASARAAES